MEPYQERVIEEKRELDDKIEKLKTFMNDEVFDELPQKEKENMSIQLSAMFTYSSALKSRIEAFEEADQTTQKPWAPLEFNSLCYQVNDACMNECMNALQRSKNPRTEYVHDELRMARTALAISQKAAAEAEDSLIRAIPGWFEQQSKGCSAMLSNIS